MLKLLSSYLREHWATLTFLGNRLEYIFSLGLPSKLLMKSITDSWRPVGTCYAHVLPAPFESGRTI